MQVFHNFSRFAQIVSSRVYGPGSGTILNNLNCIGTESSLSDCRTIDYGDLLCGHAEDIGVNCRK